MNLEYVNRDNLRFCCGVDEVEVADLDDLIDQFIDDNDRNPTTLEIAEGLLKILADEAAAHVFTDNKHNELAYDYLSKIVKPIKLGKNPNTENTIYMWVIRKSDYTNFIKKEKAKKKLIKKVVVKKAKKK